jgi:aconitate hydratase
VLEGLDYGFGISRDWAAKGQRLLGLRAVLAQSFVRIHRSNLVGVGILPLRFDPGEGADALGLTGRERYSILGLERALASDRRVVVVAEDEEGSHQFAATVLLEGPSELDSYRAGGILPAVLARLVAPDRAAPPIQPGWPESASRSSGRSTSGFAPSTSR